MIANTLYSCDKPKSSASDSSEIKEEYASEVSNSENSGEEWFKLSLAQWSLHKMIQAGDLDPTDFAQKASELGFSGIEYVSQLSSVRKFAPRDDI